MQINWLFVGLPVFIVYLSIFIYFVKKRQWTRAGLGVGLANMLIVVLNLVAPFRGVLDPAYLGYNVGLLHIPPGFGVTIVAGSIVALALASACIAVQNLRGRPMLLVAIVDTALLLLIGLPVMVTGFLNVSDYKIELGEYLFIPGIVAVLISVVLFTLPLAASVFWSTRRIRALEQ